VSPDRDDNQGEKMALVRCTKVEKGLRTGELSAEFVDVDGTHDWQLVERDFLVRSGNEYWLPVWLVHYDAKGERALVELSEESRRGYRRFWVSEADLQLPEREQAYR
jgi:hypothetical protein